jgi:hypothetical protein
MRKFVRRSLQVVLAGVLLVIIYVIVLSIDREYQRTTDLGAGVTLIETVHVFRSAFTVIADSGGSAWIPIPSRSEGVIRQKLLRNGAVLWESPAGKTYRASVSPNRQYLLLWDHVHSEWWRIYDLPTGTYREIYLPIHPGMGDGMVPLRFGRWSDDSRFIVVALDGEEVEPPHKWMRYRETYLLDPSNGNFYKQDHCHQPYPEGEKSLPRANWDDSPCAGKYED